ncbi:uracil-xanthine permease family protein [Marinobacter daepoensis]|uniref:Uracil-xanthine permease n=1 Tax=Marinobacter daepoensis TaxID=262077 RepID=A0ABS3BFW9_9GAMM|nr:uracil-xanthine permease family protein [Marinobacter daepoensis]MBN7769602.1 uracil-xanthine permease [Marinobacter daepoensis]MBY6078292.1 uracil-xanthine permease family protein [Marinobacter daepoensis]
MQESTNDPLWKQAITGSQMLLVAFGALVLMPLITGLDPNVALFTAGLGTLIFHIVTGGQIPIFLASSFAFIAPVLAAKGRFGLEETLGGLMAAGILYILLSGAVRLRGTGFITRLLPPVVIAPVIMTIGLGLASVAVHMASGRTGDGEAVLVPYDTAIWIAMASLAVTITMSVWAKGFFRLVPIMFGVVVGYLLSWFAGIVDTTPVQQAAWFAVPNFVAPAFSWGAILFMIPVAIAPAIEHIGDILAIGNVTRKNYLEKPGLHRTLLGDGLATSAASLLGGPPNTTYSEVTGAVMLTRNFNPKVMWWAACVAIVLAFVGKFGAVLQTIPVPVMGGILCLLFGSIAVVGLNTLIRHQVDLSQSRNLVIVGVTLVFGIGNMVLGQLEGIALCAVVAIVLNLILPGEREAWGKRIHEHDTH